MKSAGIARLLRERSTWLGITALFTAFGLNLSPEDAEVIITAGIALGGVIGIITRDKITVEVQAETAVVGTGTVSEQTVNAETALVETSIPTPELDKLMERETN